MSEPARTLVLGLGNVLLHDDGLGVWTVELLRRSHRFPEEVRLLEGGTLGLDLLPALDGVERLLLIDALATDGRPGRLFRLEGDEVPAALESKTSSHQVGLQDLLGTAELLGRKPPVVVLRGIEAGCLEPGTGFSPPVAAALGELAAGVLADLASWGHVATPEPKPAGEPVWWAPPRRPEPRPGTTGARALANRSGESP